MFRLLLLFAAFVLTSCGKEPATKGNSAAPENKGKEVSSDQEIDCGQYDYEAIPSTSSLTVTQTVTPNIVEIEPLVFKCVKFEHSGFREEGDINAKVHNGFFDSKDGRDLNFFLDHSEFTAAGSEYHVAEMQPQQFDASFNRGEFPSVSLDHPKIFGSSNTKRYSGTIRIDELNFDGNSSITVDIVLTALFSRTFLSGSGQDLDQTVTVKTNVKGTIEYKGPIKGLAD